MVAVVVACSSSIFSSSTISSVVVASGIISSVGLSPSLVKPAGKSSGREGLGEVVLSSPTSSSTTSSSSSDVISSPVTSSATGAKSIKVIPSTFWASSSKVTSPTVPNKKFALERDRISDAQKPVIRSSAILLANACKAPDWLFSKDILTNSDRSKSDLVLGIPSLSELREIFI